MMNFTRRAAHLFGTAVRESGQAMDRLGLMITGNGFVFLKFIKIKYVVMNLAFYTFVFNYDHAIDLYKEAFSRHRPIMKIYDKNPVLAADTFVAPNASIIGKVREKFWTS